MEKQSKSVTCKCGNVIEIEPAAKPQPQIHTKCEFYYMAGTSCSALCIVQVVYLAIQSAKKGEFNNRHMDNIESYHRYLPPNLIFIPDPKSKSSVSFFHSRKELNRSLKDIFLSIRGHLATMPPESIIYDKGIIELVKAVPSHLSPEKAKKLIKAQLEPMTDREAKKLYERAAGQNEIMSNLVQPYLGKPECVFSRKELNFVIDALKKQLPLYGRHLDIKLLESLLERARNSGDYVIPPKC